ncbi:Cullin repeat-like-containing domain protein [Mucidula mucida]|nr:Cullin repeat-like-containing domain protein [Mucidula mucida]
MDDETAEIELLEQNLNKTRQISQRMTSILNSFDTRLVKLEKSILPLYTSTQRLNKRASNIDKALLKIDELASNQEGSAVEEGIILRGPQPGQLDVYKDALERLNAAIAFQSASQDTARLVETGAKKLAQLYTKLVAEGSSGSVVSTFPSPLLLELVAFLHAARGYADMRGQWSRKGLEAKAPLLQDSSDPIPAGIEFGQWVEELVVVAEDEGRLLDDLSPLPATPISSFLHNPLLSLLSDNFLSLVNFIKRALHTHAFMALSAYEYMISLQSKCEVVFAGRSEFKDGLQSLRNVCLRSFPEFLVDLKIPKDPGGTVLAECILSTVKYLETLPEVQSAAGLALATLGDGNWKMGDGKQVGKKVDTNVSERTLLEHYAHDVVTTAVATLNNLARLPKRIQNPLLTSTFVLNNICYLRSHLIGSSGLLSKPTQEVMQSNFRMAKATYFDASYSALLNSLREQGTGKAAVKERAARFYDSLDEVVERHRGLGVLEDDDLGRRELADEVVKLVIPSLERFISKHREREFSKNPTKYIRLSVEEVDSRLRSVYR